MTDAALTNAEARRDALAAQINTAQQQIDEWKRELRNVEQFIAAWHSFAALNAPGIQRSSIASLFQSDANDTESLADLLSGKRLLKNSKKEEVAEAAREVIRERGVPVSRSDLHKALVSRGLRIEGTDPEMVLSTMLWRMRNRVARLKTGGYWLADEPSPDGSYIPSEDDRSMEHALNVPVDEIREPSPGDASIIRTIIEED